jgi:carboxyl-terminal processing protease
MKQKKYIICSIIVFFIAYYLGVNNYNIPYIKNLFFSAKTSQNNNFNTAFDLLKTEYDGSLNDSQLMEGAIYGLAESTNDPYTQYLSAAQNQGLQDDLDGNLSGIGIEVIVKDKAIVVQSSLQDSPASKNDIRSGDIIVSINKKSTENMSLDEVIKSIRGQAGSSVDIGLFRDKQLIEKNITRASIHVPSVRPEVINNILVLKISRFSKDTTVLAQAAISNNPNVAGIVMDVRGNPGGYLESAVSLSELVLPEGSIVVQEKKKDKILKVYKTQKSPITTKPLVILQNNSSASASEILAGAIQDNKRGKIVGENSFGKGSVQKIIPLTNNASMKITTAHWYTPNDKNIGKKGISADINIKDDNYSDDNDIELKKAIETIK